MMGATLGGEQSKRMSRKAKAQGSEVVVRQEGDGEEGGGGGGDDMEGEEGDVVEAIASTVDSGDYGAACEALGETIEYDSISLNMRCNIVECLAHLLMETTICARFFEASGRAGEKLQELKRNEYKTRNGVIEGEEQAKLAEKYGVERPPRLSQDRSVQRQRKKAKKEAASGGGGGAAAAGEEAGEEVEEVMVIDGALGVEAGGVGSPDPNGSQVEGGG